MSEFYKVESRLMRGAVLATLGMAVLSSDTAHNVAAAKYEHAAEAYNERLDRLGSERDARHTLLNAEACTLSKATDTGPAFVAILNGEGSGAPDPVDLRNRVAATVDRPANQFARAAKRADGSTLTITTKTKLVPEMRGIRSSENLRIIAYAPAGNPVGKPGTYKAHIPYPVTDRARSAENFTLLPLADWKPGARMTLDMTSKATTGVGTESYSTTSRQRCANWLSATADPDGKGVIWKLMTSPAGPVELAETFPIERPQPPRPPR